MSEEGRSSHQDEKAIAKEVVKAMMILDFTKKPFKYSDIACFLTRKPSKTGWARVIKDAGNQLQVMGLTLHEVKNTYTKMYFLVSNAQPFPGMYKYASEEEISNRTLLTLVLAFLFINHNFAYADNIFDHLKALGIYNNSETIHPYFGNVRKKVLTEFVEQLYLSSTKLADSDLIEVRWGQRAECEITKRSILEFICNYGLEGTVSPELLTSYYAKVKEQEAQAHKATTTVTTTATVTAPSSSAAATASPSTSAATSVSSSTFAGPSTSSDPFAGPSTSSEPFASPSTSADAFAGPSTSADPFAGPSTSAGPSAGPSTSTDPSAGPFAGPSTSAGPSAGPSTSADPSAGPSTSAGPSAGPSTFPARLRDRSTSRNN